MAIVRAVKTGNWSDTTVWNTGALPTSSDDVYSNTFTVTIDTSPTVLSISNAAATGVTVGGGFVISSTGLTLTCTGTGITAGATTTVCLDVTIGSGSTATVSGNATTGGISTTTAVRLSGAGTLNYSGSISVVSASGGSNTGVLNSSTGTVNITTTGATGGANTGSYAISNTSSGTITITGNCTGGTNSTGYAVNNNSTGSISITGNCTGGTAGTGAVNASTGAITITGTISGGSGSTSYGAANNSTGTLTHVGTAQAGTGTAAIGGGAIGQITILSGPLLSTDASAGGAAASGVNPVIAVRWFPADNALSTFEYRLRGQTVSGSPSARPARQLFLPDAYSATYPSAANVRSGTTYGPASIYTGSCAVPAAASVLFGVPVDATTGTVTITAADIRSALGLSAANLDTQLSGINTAATNAPTNVPPAVRTNLTAELARLSNAATTAEVSDIVTAAV